MRKASEIRSLDAEQLRAEEQRLRKLIFEQRNKASRGKPEKPHELKATRRELAKILTVQRERRGALAAEARRA